MNKNIKKRLPLRDINEKVRLVPYNPAWSRLANREISSLRKALGPTALGIEHHGSTSVPGMASKPVIDILVGVSELTLPERTRASLKAIGYQYVGKRLGQERLYLIKRGKTNFNLGVVIYEGPLWRASLGLTEYLRCHPREVVSYRNEKKRLIAAGYNRLFEYSDAKAPFIEKMKERARRWQKRTERVEKPKIKTQKSVHIWEIEGDFDLKRLQTYLSEMFRESHPKSMSA